MKFTLNLAAGEYRDFITLAETADARGWFGISTPDSLFATDDTDSDYPYADTKAIRAYIEAMPFIEPIVAMTWMAARTKQLNFFTAVMKIPVRQPLVLAKMFSSLAALSDNRVLIGAGLSPWREDFAYNGVDFSKRGKLMDECIAIIRGATSGEWFEYHSDNYDIGRIRMSPAPTKPIPVLIGGHAGPALKRAARIGDGWIAANCEIETLTDLVTQLNAHRVEVGTADNPDYQIHATVPFTTDLDVYRRLADIGVTHIYGSPFQDPTADINTRLDEINRFSDEVVTPLSQK